MSKITVTLEIETIENGVIVRHREADRALHAPYEWSLADAAGQLVQTAFSAAARKAKAAGKDETQEEKLEREALAAEHFQLSAGKVADAFASCGHGRPMQQDV